MGEDDRAVLRPDVRPLPVRRGRVVVLPEDAQEISVGDAGGVVLHVDDFGVSRAVGADVLIGRVGQGSSGVADGGRGDAGHLAKSGLHSPETSGAEGGSLRHSDGSGGILTDRADPSSFAEAAEDESLRSEADPSLRSG